jgi:Glycosyltransferase family 87
MGAMTAVNAPGLPAPEPAWSTPTLAILGLGALAAVVVRLLVLPSYVLLGDLDQYARWAHHLATDLPFGAAYRQDFSYMPVLVAVFGALARLVPAFATAGDAGDVGVRIALKVPALLGEVAIVAGLFTVLRQRPHRAAAAILAVLLVPATWYLGAWWGQLDALYVALCLWAAILASRDRPRLFAVVLGLAMMTKPQALFLAAPFGAYAIGRWGVRRAALVGLVAVVVALLTWLPFVPYGGVADYLRNLDYYQNNQYPILSMRAWNPWWLLQVALGGDQFVLDSTPVLGPLTPRYLGLIATAVGEILVFVAVVRRATTERLYLGLAAATLAAFCLMTSMHERYAYAALVFLAPVLDRRPVQLAWGILAVAISLNVVAGAAPGQIGPIIQLTGPMGIVGSVGMILATAIICAVLLSRRSGRRATPRERGPMLPDLS